MIVRNFYRDTIPHQYKKEKESYVK